MNSTILTGDALEQLKTIESGVVNTCVTSPPYYGLRDYGVDGQIGLEETPEQYISKLVEVFREVRRALRDDGTLWVNVGDSYWGGGWRGAALNEHSGDIQKAHIGTHCGDTMPLCKGRYKDIKDKDLIGIPWMLAFALRADGWYLRQDIIWHKPNPMPESVKDRCTKSHEYIFLLSKAQRYYYDAEAIAEPALWERWGDQTENKTHPGTAGHLGGKTRAELPIKDTKNKRSVWTVTTKPYKEAHFATYPPDLIEPCILAGCPFEGTVLDPFTGSGTTAVVALQNGRNFIGVELNPKYVTMAQKRIKRDGHYQERMLTHG